MIKKMMIRGMDAVMLSCEEATFLMTKSEFEKVGCIKRMQLKMHLAGCEFCRRFKIQSELIDQSLRTLENIKTTETKNFKPLDDNKKKELETLVEEQL